MCQNCAGKAPVKFSRRQVLAMCIAVPACGAAIGFSQRTSSVAAPATSLEPVAMPVVAAPSQPAPNIDPLRGRQPEAWGMDLPGIVRTVPTVPGRRTMALTFDACSGDEDQKLLDTLHEFGVPATLFVNSRWIDLHADLTRQLIADPLFSVQNHGTTHLPLSVTGRAAYGIAGTATIDQALDEVTGCRDRVRSAYGHTMTWFRSGTAHYDDVAVAMCDAHGIKIAGFTTNIDSGATAKASTVTAEILGAPDGSIGLGHMNHPESGTAAGVRAALQRLHGQNVNFVKL